MKAVNRRGERGAVALEYILIAAVMTLGVVGALRVFGREARKTINHSRSPGSEEARKTVETGFGGALEELE